MAILVTGGCGFIGTNFIIDRLKNSNEPIINVDKITYASNRKALLEYEAADNYHFICGDIADRNLVKETLDKFKPNYVVNFAAESHVDRSIEGPSVFLQSNTVGAFNLLDEARVYWSNLDQKDREMFRFLQISTDEVFGSLGPTDPAFSEMSNYDPSSPYSASKAAADHMVNAYFKTFGMPTLITNCSNNYGPHQFPEKLIPLCIKNALEGKTIPIYGNGLQVRDWLFVSDHCSAISLVLRSGAVGQTYAIGGESEKTNREVVDKICEILDQILGRYGSSSHKQYIAFVDDRPGHDQRYAIDATKIKSELGWQSKKTFDDGLFETVSWYLKQWGHSVN